MYNRNLQKIVEGPQNPPVKPLSGKDEIIEQPTNTPPQQTTPTGGELAKQRYEAWKKARPAEDLTENPIEKYTLYPNGIFDVTYKDKSKEKIYPNNRSQKQIEGDTSTMFYMGTYDGNWKFTMDDAKTTYDKYGDKAWLTNEEMKELGIKNNPTPVNTKK